MRSIGLSRLQIAGLKRIGYWWSNDEPDLPHPRDYVDYAWDAVEREKVNVYLNEQCSKLTRFSPGYSWCRLGCTPIPPDIGNGECTDGIWLFPEGFAHYVRHHMVKPPEDFLDHMRRMSFLVSRLPWSIEGVER
jgi:hypothetical protein